MPRQIERLAHSVYECKYHIAFFPKDRYRVLRDRVGEYTKQQVYRLSQQKEAGDTALWPIREGGAPAMIKRVVGEHRRSGRREDTVVCRMARETREATRSHPGSVI